MSFFITRHARVRMQQRGIKHTRLASVLEYADLSNPVSRHLSAIRVSKRAVQEAIADGVDPQEMKRAFRMVVINSVDGALGAILQPILRLWFENGSIRLEIQN